MQKLLNFVSTWTRLPVLPTKPQFSSFVSLRSLIHPSTPISFSGFPGNRSWMMTRTFSLSQGASSGRISHPIISCSGKESFEKLGIFAVQSNLESEKWWNSNAISSVGFYGDGLTFQLWKLSFYVINAHASPIYTIFGVIAVFPKLTRKT